MTKLLSVHPKHIKKVNLAWNLKKEGREQELADELGRALTLVIVNLFLKGQPVNRHNFIEICQILGLNWQEIAGFAENQAFSPPIEAASQVTTNSFNSLEGVGDIDKAINDLVSTLCEMLRRLTRKAGNLLRADRTSIFLLDQQTQQLGSVVAEDGAGGYLLIDIPANKGFAGLAAMSLEVINVPFDVYDDPRSEASKDTDRKTGYRTYTMLTWPLLNEQRDLIAVVQLINKLKPNYNHEDELFKRIDTNGFTKEDEVRFSKFAPSILKILEECRFCYQLYLKLRKNPGLNQASVVSHTAALITELRRREQLLRKSLAKI
ncbi:MAG: GAF domain-containing protein [Coleofasciculus sp. S288]|nr:GAF domain-containing protein [Coleofasciculus sp. S288]